MMWATSASWFRRITCASSGPHPAPVDPHRPTRITPTRIAPTGNGPLKLPKTCLPFDAFLMMHHVTPMQTAMLGGGMAILPETPCDEDWCGAGLPFAARAISSGPRS
jgi:hypothetical protein